MKQQVLEEGIMPLHLLEKKHTRETKKIGKLPKS